MGLFKSIRKIMKYIGIFILALLLGFVVNMLVTKDDSFKADWNDSVGKVHLDIPYGDGELNKYDLYVPADASKETYGLVIYLHPGGFTTGDKSGDAEVAKWLVSKGFVASSINYTVRNEKYPTASIFSMSNEIKKAVPKVVEKARELGYNVDRMAMAGGSAGAGLAAIYAYRDGHEAPVPIKFLWGAVGPTSFELDSAGEVTDESATGSAMFMSVLSGQEITAEMIKNGSYLEVMKPIEAARWVNENSPPTLMAYGKYDHVMPFSNRPLIEALEKHNIPNDIIIFEHSGHGLHRDRDKQKLLNEKINEYLEKYLR